MDSKIQKIKIILYRKLVKRLKEKYYRENELLLKKRKLSNEQYLLRNRDQKKKEVKSLKRNNSTIRGYINKKGSLKPNKKIRAFIATTRNMTLVKYLKNLYQDQCQICGEAIEISPNNFLSEVHHIQPLGAHNGADVLENMIVLCPNHHAMFDRGAITVDIDKKIVLHCNPYNPLHNKPFQLKHDVGRAYIDYHNQNIFLAKIKPIVRKQDNDTQTQIVRIPKNSVGQFVNYGNIVSLQDIDTKESFDVRIEDKFNKDFMKPIEKVLLQRYLDEIVCFDGFKYAITRINKP